MVLDRSSYLRFCLAAEGSIKLEMGICLSEAGAICPGLNHLWHWPDASLILDDRPYYVKLCSVLPSVSKCGFWLAKISLAWRFLILGVCILSLGWDGVTEWRMFWSETVLGSCLENIHLERMNLSGISWLDHMLCMVNTHLPYQAPYFVSASA